MQKEKFLKTMAILSGIAGIIVFLSENIFINAVKIISKGNLTLHSGDAASIGIIGGADGPTSIFLASNGFTWMKELLTVVCFIISILFTVKYRKMKNNSGGNNE